MIIEGYTVKQNGVPPKPHQKVIIFSHGLTQYETDVGTGKEQVSSFIVPKDIRIFLYVPIGTTLTTEFSKVSGICLNDDYIKNNVYRIYNEGAEINDIRLYINQQLIPKRNGKILNKFESYINFCGKEKINLKSYLNQKVYSISLENLMYEIIKKNHGKKLDLHVIACRTLPNDDYIPEELILEKMSAMNLHEPNYTKTEYRSSGVKQPFMQPGFDKPKELSLPLPEEPLLFTRGINLVFKNQPWESRRSLKNRERLTRLTHFGNDSLKNIDKDILYLKSI